jgi:hypothetical protein
MARLPRAIRRSATPSIEIGGLLDRFIRCSLNFFKTGLLWLFRGE